MSLIATAHAAGLVLDVEGKPADPRHNLEAIGRTLYGSRWQIALAAACKVSPRQVRRWQRRPSDIDRWVFYRLRDVAKERRDACDLVIASLANPALRLGDKPSSVTAPAPVPVAVPSPPTPKLGPREIVARAAASVAAYRESKDVETGADFAVMVAIEDTHASIEQEAPQSPVSSFEDKITIATATDSVQPPVRPRPRGRPGFVPPALRPVLAVTKPQPSPEPATEARTAPVAVRDHGISLSEIVGNGAAQEAHDAIRRLTYDDLLPGDRIKIRYRTAMRTAHVLGRHENGGVLVSDQLSSGEWRPLRPLNREDFAEVTFRDKPTPELPEAPSTEVLRARSARAAWLATLGAEDVRVGDEIEIEHDAKDGKGRRGRVAWVTHEIQGRLKIRFRTRRGVHSQSFDGRRFVRIIGRPVTDQDLTTVLPETENKRKLDPVIRELRLAEWKHITASVAINDLIAGDMVFVEGSDQSTTKALVTRAHADVVYIAVSNGAGGYLPERLLVAAEYMSLFDRVGLRAEIEAKFPEHETEAA